MPQYKDYRNVWRAVLGVFGRRGQGFSGFSIGCALCPNDREADVPALRLRGLRLVQ
jgi:hypothetical protein